MSAFIVDADHIDALVTYAVRHQVSFWNGAERIQITRFNAEEIGRQLLDANVASVSHRYRGDIGDDGDPAAEYKFREFRQELSAVQILVGCECLDYQSCERDDWELSIAWRILQAIRNQAVRAFPGREGAQWEIRRQAPAPAPVIVAARVPMTPGQKAAATRRARRAAR